MSYCLEAGVYPCKMVLRREGDVRVYEIEATVNAVGIQTQIDFAAPAMQSIIQDIPISNSSDVDWNLRSEVAGDDSFTGPRTFVVEARSEAKYPLTFKPLSFGEVRPILLLSQTIS